MCTRVDGPSLLWDGQGYLGAARWVARDDWPLLGELDFYHPSYGALLAPSIWLGASPMGLFRWAQAVNVLSLAVAAIALGALARTLLPEGRTWLFATAAACAYPALVLQSAFEWPEVSVAAAFAVAAACAWRERWLGLSLATVAMYALHPRALGVVVVTLALLVAHRRWRSTAVLIAGFVGVQVLNRLALHALYNPGRRSGTRSAFDTITDVGSWPDVAVRAAGHSWYLVVATLGLAAVAVVALARDRRPPALWLLGAGLAVLGASALQLAGRGRADHLVYGRYVETLAPVLIVVAASALRPIAFAIAGASAATLAAVTVAGNDGDAFGRTPAYINVPVLTLVGEVNVPVTTIAAVVAGGALALVAWRAPRLALAAFGVAALTAATGAWVLDLKGFSDDANETYVMGDDVARFADGGRVAYDIDAYDKLASNRYQWQHPGIELPYWSHDDLPASTVLAGKGAPPVAGARIVSIEPLRDLALWVAPGPAQDALAARGWLVLENAQPVDESFYDARIERVDDTHVRITHAGGGGPWVPAGSLPGDVGLVRVLGASSTPIRLPRLLHPGESLVLAVPSHVTRIELEHVHHRTFAATTI